ncbi:MAG: hypothetical protein Unbinned1693contig1002_58 [Prokaryotic dsDNA virus sp.]|jgi:hypothetical protein|nr:MAG: hypothetical protein Unbinned1693contig1002_58 [Prokaryotic dsDNA virus sp.]|tara:strand:+ start:18260 stop:19156 length:897 start_codon:yes stop_codon:yes gene_type:complete
MAYGISQLENRSWTFRNSITVEGDFTIEGDLTFGDAATDTLSVTGLFSQTYSGTDDGHTVAGTGNLTAGEDLVRFSTTGSISSTSNVLAVEQTTGAGAAGAYGLYVNCTGTNVEAIKVDAGDVVFDEDLNVTGTITGGTVTDGTFSVTGGAITGATTIAMGGGLSGVTTLAASGDVTLTTAGVVSSVSNATMGWYLSAAMQAITGSGAITITEYFSTMNTTGGGAYTLADSTIKGQLKKIQLIVDAGDATLTPTSLNGGSTITFADVGDYCLLIWDGSRWQVLELNNMADGVSAPVLA